MNKVVLTGRLTKDVEMRSTADGKTVATFALAVERIPKDKGAYFFNCSAWGNTADALNRFTRKGDKIAIYGRLTSRNYEKDGEKRTAVEITAEEVEFIHLHNAMAELPSDDELPFK